MQKSFISSCIIALMLFTSCKSIYIKQESHKTTTQSVQLGTVGEQKDFVLEQDYNHTAIPKYKKAVKVQVDLIAFNKASFKAFTKAKTAQSKDIAIHYVDSLAKKPKYLKLEIADRVSILNALNSKENRDVFQFLENKKNAHVVTSVSMALNESDLVAVQNADEVFLEMQGIKSYGLRTYKNKKAQQTILFNQGVIFAYQTSSCCWKQNDKYQLEIVDLAEGNDDCPNRTSRSSKRAKKEINYYKF